MPILDPAG